MKFRIRAALAAGVALTIFATASHGGERDGCGWHPGSAYQRMCEDRSTTAFSGTIEGVDTVIPLDGMEPGMRLAVRTGAGRRIVHIGPQWFVAWQQFSPVIGDSIDVTGLEISFRGEKIVAAARIDSGGMRTTWRREDGFPLWAGKR